MNIDNIINIGQDSLDNRTKNLEYHTKYNTIVQIVFGFFIIEPVKGVR